MSWPGRLLIILGLAFFSYWASARYLVAPVETESFSILERQRSLRAEKIALAERLTRESSERAAWEKLRKEVSSVKLAIPPKEEITRLIARLPELADSSGVTINSVNYRPFKKAFENYQLLEFNMPVTGSYQNIRHFIHELELMESNLLIKAIRLRQSNRKPGKIALQINVSAYYNDER